VFEEVYLPGLLSRLEGPALRTRLAADVRSLALAVLGSTGGAGEAVMGRGVQLQHWMHHAGAGFNKLSAASILPDGAASPVPD
jgi:hypothetical protein